MAANRTVIIDLLRTHVQGRLEATRAAQEEVDRLNEELTALNEALYQLESIGR